MSGRSAAWPLALLLAWGAVLGAAYEWGGPAGRGVRQLRKGANADALGSLAAGAADLPRSAAVRFDRGIAFQRLGRPDSARAAYEEAMRQEGTRARAAAAYNLGNEALRAKRFAEAIERYRESLREDWTRADAKRNLEEAIRRARESKTPQSPPPSGGGGSQGPTGPGKGSGKGATPPPSGPKGAPPPGSSGAQAPQNLGGPIPSKEEAELWLKALESERRSERERDARQSNERDRSGRDW